MKNVTVVVPVYKDWNTLKLCLDSLKKYVKQNNQVFFINDLSSEWEELEKKIISEIKNLENFYYFRNEFNMGFVKTCNRAVFELERTGNDILLLNSDTKVTQGFIEEMSRVLYLSEKHGIVCPRSNNASLLTVPIKNNLGKLLEPEESYCVYKKIKKRLPEYKVIPTGVGFAMLIRRQLIYKFGLFDEIYGLGYNEENDYCMRINQYGYSIIMANNAYVYHFHNKSFGDLKLELEKKNSIILNKRYPYYKDIVRRYMEEEIDAVDYFADLIDDKVYLKKRLLISLYELPSAYTGTTEYGMAILHEFYKLFGNTYDIYVLVNKRNDDFLKISQLYENVLYPDNIIGHTFHMAFIPSQIFGIEHLFLLNKTCLRFIFNMQDIISLRSNYILIYDYERLEVFKKSIQYCDAMISISEFSLKDTKDYFADVFQEREVETRVIYHGNKEKTIKITKKNYELKYKKYYVIVGNQFKHKFIREIIETIKKSKYNFIIIGAKETGVLSQNIFGYESGMLSDDFVYYLFLNSQGIIFPSIYEGFGLPVLNGIEYDKKIILCDTELNHELKDYYKFYSDNIYIYNKMDEIENLLDNIEANPKVAYKDGVKKVRTWQDVAVETEALINKRLKSEVNYNVINKRWRDLCYLESVHKTIKSIPHKERMKIMLRKRWPNLYEGIRRIKEKTVKFKN